MPCRRWQPQEDKDHCRTHLVKPARATPAPLSISEDGLAARKFCISQCPSIPTIKRHYKCDFSELVPEDHPGT